MRKLFLFIGLILTFQGCSHIVVETIPLTITDKSTQAVPIVVIPFSDYSGDEPTSMGDRSSFLISSLNAALIKYGFIPSPYEDVVEFLLDKGVLRTVQVEPPYKEDHLKDFSLETQGFIRSLYQQQTQRKAQKTVPVDHKLLGEIGKRFQSRYVLRGRIVEMGITSAQSFNPAQTGILPFIFKTGSRFVFGVGSTDTYELVNKMALGAIVGSAFAQGRFPLHPTRFDAKDEENIKDLNRAIWAAGGPGLAWLGQKSGEVEAGVIHLEMLLQDALTGRPLWANSIRVDVTPESVFYVGDKDSLLKVAIERAVDRLVEDLTKTLNSRS